MKKGLPTAVRRGGGQTGRKWMDEGWDRGVLKRWRRGGWLQKAVWGFERNSETKIKQFSIPFFVLLCFGCQTCLKISSPYMLVMWRRLWQGGRRVANGWWMFSFVFETFFALLNISSSFERYVWHHISGNLFDTHKQSCSWRRFSSSAL